MKKFINIFEVINSVSELNWDSALFCKLDDWRIDPERCEIVVLEGDDELEDLIDIENHIPRIAADLGVVQLLDAETFGSVLEVQKKIKNDSSPQDYLHAINHYREYDDFFDPEN